MATCAGCGARVIWLENDKTGKRAPVDPVPVPEGNVTLDQRRGTYHVLTKAETQAIDAPGMFDAPPPDRFSLHFSTCPQADHFRRDKIAHRDRPGRNR